MGMWPRLSSWPIFFSLCLYTFAPGEYGQWLTREITGSPCDPLCCMPRGRHILRLLHIHWRESAQYRRLARLRGVALALLRPKPGVEGTQGEVSEEEE
ncbi:uncharacterized protein B0I36DRAFT_322158 [Microdochium trichocladiopsis]|uniref:Secreted protein n=1 Tax=Microdochium trichocladiopsis TaxID=1682393 RepID=A0A9P8Y7X6_9PEZI|nr:uncharacterized protein B0I36DRAFT_322158 [Microdochium trichocladiopsis]KAH7030636.1 hypothetical protein B0I36DRAFT_322158 [Microdochium trichocladiopsis]